MSLSRRALLATIAATATTPITACDHPPAPTAAPTGSRDTVVYLTGFGSTPREDYPYAGLLEGFFAQSGIELSIHAGAPSDANLKLLAAGKAQFASIDWVSAVDNTDKYPDFRAVAAVQNATLLSMITVPDRGILRPADLAGRRVGFAGRTAASRALFPTYAKLAGFDPGGCLFSYAAPDQLPALLRAGRIDAMGSYAVDTPVVAAATRTQPVVLPYSTYLGDLYGTVLVTSTNLLRVNPGLVHRFTAALVRSARFAVDNPQLAGQLIHRALPVTHTDAVTQTMTLMKQYVTTPVLDPTKVIRSIALLEDADLAPSGLQPDRVVDFNIAGAN